MGAVALATATAVLPGVGEHRLVLVVLLALVLAPLMWIVESWAAPRGMFWSQSALDATALRARRAGAARALDHHRAGRGVGGHRQPQPPSPRWATS